MPWNLAWTQKHGELNVTNASKVVVYTLQLRGQRNSPFSPSTLFSSVVWLVYEYEDYQLYKYTVVPLRKLYFHSHPENSYALAPLPPPSSFYRLIHIQVQKLIFRNSSKDIESLLCFVPFIWRGVLWWRCKNSEYSFTGRAKRKMRGGSGKLCQLAAQLLDIKFPLHTSLNHIWGSHQRWDL